jgi:hypothetical protein
LVSKEKYSKKNLIIFTQRATEQMHLDQLEKYPVGTDKWDEQFELYDAWSGYNKIDNKGSNSNLL